MDGGAQATAFTLWSFVLIDYSSPILIVCAISTIVLLGFASYMIENKISMESFVIVVANIFFFYYMGSIGFRCNYQWKYAHPKIKR